MHFKTKITWSIFVLILFVNIILLLYQIFNTERYIDGYILNIKEYPYSLVKDQENIYYIGKQYSEFEKRNTDFIYQMKLGEEEPRKIDNVPSSGMKFYKLFVDSKGILYAFVCDEQNEKCEIWKFINDKSSTEKIDITSIIQKSDVYGVSTFLVDFQGRYYLREYISRETIVLNANGTELCRIPDDDRGIHCMGIARDGEVYALTDIPEENSIHTELVRLNVENNSFEVKQKDFLPVEDLYSMIQPGNDCDLLILGVRKSYAYSFNQNKIKQLGDSFHINNFDYNATTSCFLNDRTLIMIAKNQRKDEKIQYGDIRIFKCFY